MATDEERSLVVDENSPQFQPLNHERDVYVLSSAFLLIFLAYGAIQNLESTINTEGDLGTTSFGILYLSFTFFFYNCFIGGAETGIEECFNSCIASSSPFVLWMTTSNTILSQAMYRDTMLATILFLAHLAKITNYSWYTMVPSSLYLGFAASITWVGQLVGNLVNLAVLRDGTCSLVAGRLTSGLTSITIIVLGGALIQIFVLLWLLLNYSVTGGVLATMLPLLLGALWGIGDGVLNTQLSALLGILFKHDLEGAFAQLKLWQSVSISVVFFISTSISWQTMVVIILVALFISVAAFLLLHNQGGESVFAQRFASSTKAIFCFICPLSCISIIKHRIYVETV